MEEGASLLNFVLSPARNPKQAQRRGGVVEVAEWEGTESGDTEFLPQWGGQAVTCSRGEECHGELWATWNGVLKKS